MIELHSVTHSYPMPKRYRDYLVHPLRPTRRAVALREIELSVGAGEHIAVLGPNGAGKTTLLKLIGGLLYPTRGAVTIGGLNTIRDNHAVRRRVGFVINEERSFYWRLSGRQNLEFFGALENLFGTALRARIEVLLDYVGLSRAGEHPVATYSAGMKQRLAIARGLLADPEVLLLDEPTKSLDPSGANDIRALLARRTTEGKRRTLIVTTNQLADVPLVCDRVCVIHNHTIAALHPLAGLEESDIAALYRAATGLNVAA